MVKNTYLGTKYSLYYLSVDQITAALCKPGPAAQIFKIDINRTFRKIKIDPGNIDLLGLKFQDMYFADLSVAFGFSYGSKLFQRCTDAMCYIMNQHGFPNLFNYKDDLFYVGLPSKYQPGFQLLR